MQNQKSDWGRDLILVAVAMFVLTIGFEGIYISIYNNFVSDDLGITRKQLGVVESIRETPGFLSAFIAALTIQIPSPILGGFMLLIMGTGIAAFSQVHTISSLTFWAVFWSVGFHCWAPLEPAMVLSLSKDKGKGKRLGQMARIRNAAGLAGMILIAVIGKQGNLRSLFYFSGAAILVAAFIVFLVSRKATHMEMPRLAAKKKYGLYYALAFLQGCRKQIFVVFAGFVLVRVYETRVSTIARLMAVNKIANLIFAPIIGRIVDRIGERKSLSICYTALIFIFLGYGLAHDHRILYVIYCLDSFVYMFSIAQTTYLNKIAPPEDVRPALSMSLTMNHAASVIVPVVGGIIWEALDSYEVVFFGGAAVAVISLLVVQFLKVDKT
ncbi:MFS transporter [Candidatus Poribacteria bacterium]